MMKGNRKKWASVAAALALALSLSTPIFVQATEQSPEISITWLSVDGEPMYYNSDLDMLTLRNSEMVDGYTRYGNFFVIDLATGTKVDTYDFVHMTFDERIAVGKYNAEGNLKYGYLDTSGSVIVPFEYDGFGSFFNGSAITYKNSSDKKSYYIISKNGDLTASLEQEYDYVSTIVNDNNLILVMKSGVNGIQKYGYISKDGSVIIPLEYDWQDTFQSPTLSWELYFSDDLVAVTKGGKWGYVDETGNMIIPLEYDFASSFSDGLAWVVKDGKCGYIDKTGKVIIPLEYDVPPYSWLNYWHFSCGLSPVFRVDGNGNEKYGYIDKTGKVVIPLEYDYASCFFENLACIVKNNKWGFIDTTGSVVGSLDYDGDFQPDYFKQIFSDSLAIASKYDENGTLKYGFVDKSGTVVIPLNYDRVGPIYETMDYTKGITVPGRYYWIQKGASYGIFENPYYEAKKEDGNIVTGPTDQVMGNTGNSSSDTPTKGSGFPVVPVAVCVVAAGAVAAVLVLRKKKPTTETANVPPAQKVQPPRPTAPPERPQASGPKFCSNCGKPLTPGVKFCPECGQPLQSKEG